MSRTEVRQIAGKRRSVCEARLQRKRRARTISSPLPERDLSLLATQFRYCSRSASRFTRSRSSLFFWCAFTRRSHSSLSSTAFSGMGDMRMRRGLARRISPGCRDRRFLSSHNRALASTSLPRASFTHLSSSTRIAARVLYFPPSSTSENVSRDFHS